MAGGNRPGVRGPRGPQGEPDRQGRLRRPAGPGRSDRSAKPGPAAAPAQMSAFHRASLPLLMFLTRIPRWLTVVVLATVLVLGVIQTGSLAWLGALLLCVLALFFLWLLLLSWPRISPSGRFLRGAVVVALVMAAVFKLMGRF